MLRLAMFVAIVGMDSARFPVRCLGSMFRPHWSRRVTALSTIAIRLSLYVTAVVTTRRMVSATIRNMIVATIRTSENEAANASGLGNRSLRISQSRVGENIEKMKTARTKGSSTGRL